MGSHQVNQVLMGYREYARHRGVTLGAVQKAIRTQRIAVNADGKIDQAAADRAWDANTDASRSALSMGDQPMSEMAFSRAEPPLAQSAGADATDDSAGAEELRGNDRVANDYRESRATRERYQALKQRLEYEQLSGALINVDDAKRIAYTSFRALRDAMMNVAPRIKDQLAAQTDAHLCEQLVENEISAALAGIDVAKLLKDQSDTED